MDLVLHSATKGIGGHNDATLGVIAGERRPGRRDLGLLGPARRGGLALRRPQRACGASARCRCGWPASQPAAQQLAAFLEAPPGVARVLLPRPRRHPQHDLAKRQMRRGGIADLFELAGGLEGGPRFVEGVRLARHGGVAGRARDAGEPPGQLDPRQPAADELAAAGITPGLVRISVGLEHADDLQADFAQALAALDPASDG